MMRKLQFSKVFFFEPSQPCEKARLYLIVLFNKTIVAPYDAYLVIWCKHPPKKNDEKTSVFESIFFRAFAAMREGSVLY